MGKISEIVSKLLNRLWAPRGKNPALSVEPTSKGQAGAADGTTVGSSIARTDTVEHFRRIGSKHITDSVHRLKPQSQTSLVPPSQPKRKPHNVAINIGIDFGTRFTKVCIRYVGTEFTKVVCLTGTGLEGALFPSIVAVNSQGRVRLPMADSDSNDEVFVRYLKMKIAGQSFGEPLPKIGAFDLNDADLAQALACWYLATTIVRTKKWVMQNEADRVRGMEINWSANVGVPVEYCDSDKLKVFQAVLGAAWLMAEQAELGCDLSSLIRQYETARSRQFEETDCHAIPEIAAAVQSFVMSRSALPGRYIYFDIGGGTIDGVAFYLVKDGGALRVNFYSGKVEPLGVDALAEKLGIKPGTEMTDAVLGNVVDPLHLQTVAEVGRGVQKLVGGVIWEAKQKDISDWRVPVSGRKNVGELEPHQIRPLQIFIGGGGARVRWIFGKIGSTYHDFNHHMADIPPYNLTEVLKPPDLDMNSINEREYLRFAIAYGLSVPFGEGPDIGLPSQFKKVGPRPVRVLPGVVDYLDSKDAHG